MHVEDQIPSRNTYTVDGINAAYDAGTSVPTAPHQGPMSASNVADLQAIRQLTIPSTIDQKIYMLRQINEVLELSKGYVCMQQTSSSLHVAAHNTSLGYTPFSLYVTTWFILFVGCEVHVDFPYLMIPFSQPLCLNCLTNRISLEPQHVVNVSQAVTDLEYQELKKCIVIDREFTMQHQSTPLTWCMGSRLEVVVWHKNISTLVTCDGAQPLHFCYPSIRNWYSNTNS